MKITSITITKTINNKRQLADVTITIDYSLLINNIKLLHNDKKMFVEFSSTKREYSNIISPDVVPLNANVRAYIEREIITEYQRTGGTENEIL